MAFNMPDLKALSQMARNAFRSEMPGTDAWIWPNNVYVSAKVFAGILYQLFMRLKWIDKQRFAMTATLDGLLKMGQEYGIPLHGATYAQGNVDVPAVAPYTVPAGTVFTRSDGITYISTQDVSAVSYSNSGAISVPVVCQTVGKTGNCLAGTSLSTTLTGLTGDVATVVVDDSGIGQGADVEDVESYRTRILARKRKTPMGGAAYDYVSWAKDVSGVTRVFVAKNAFGPGTVGVWFMMDDTYPFGIPQASDVANVQTHIDSKAPVTANAFVLGAQAETMNVVVGPIYPDTPAIRNSIAAEMQTLFKNMTQPGIPGSSFTLYHSWLNQAVSNATGVYYDEAVTTPAADLTFTAGAIPCLGSVSFTPAS